MASETMDYSLEDLIKLSVKQLKSILRDNGESVSGQKSTIVSRTFALIGRRKAEGKLKIDKVSDTEKVSSDSIPVDCTFKDVLSIAGDAEWQSDLRNLPDVNFHQVYDYLVQKTKKYGDKIMKGTAYKRERSYGFYKEGHIVDVRVARNTNLVSVRAKVIASMKKIKYGVVVVFCMDGDVKYASCECPAGLGNYGEGKCNHIVGLLFLVEDFCSKKA